MKKLMSALVLVLVCVQCWVAVPATRADQPNPEAVTITGPPIEHEENYGPPPWNWFWRPDYCKNWAENQQMAVDVFFFTTGIIMFIWDN